MTAFLVSQLVLRLEIMNKRKHYVNEIWEFKFKGLHYKAKVLDVYDENNMRVEVIHSFKPSVQVGDIRTTNTVNSFPRGWRLCVSHKDESIWDTLECVLNTNA